MLGSENFHQFRLQNENENPIDSSFKFCLYLPANYYPIQSPGYTVHWNERKFIILERSGLISKIVVEVDVEELDKSSIFSALSGRTRKRLRNNSDGMIKNFIGWIKSNWNPMDSKSSAFPKEEIVKIIPLMIDETIFDFIAVICKKNEIYGFTRFKALMTGNIKIGGKINRMDGFIPSIRSEIIPEFLQWNHFLFAVTAEEIKFIHLVEGAEWKSLEINGISGRIGKVVKCEDKLFNSNQVVLHLTIVTECSRKGDFGTQDKSIEVNSEGHTCTCEQKCNSICKQESTISNTISALVHLVSDGLEIKSKIISTSKINCDCGYIENEFVYLINNSNFYKISLNSSETCKIFNSITFGDLWYLFPWRQDFKISALIINLIRNQEKYEISISSINGIESKNILKTDFRSSREIVSIFASSSLEIFLLDREGNSLIYSGLLLSETWNNHDKRLNSMPIFFEFSSWFNILGSFSFLSVDYYENRRKNVMTTLFIDDLLSSNESFPPRDWKELGISCTKLMEQSKIDVILYYLLCTSNDSLKLSSFYSQYGLIDRQVAKIEILFFFDHGNYEDGVKVFCTRKLDDKIILNLLPKMVLMINNDQIHDGSEILSKLSLFASGRIIPLDLLFDEEETLNLILRNLLKTRTVSCVLEWIKGLFAWLRPDERCALIPVNNLHQILLKRLIRIILNVPCNSEFKLIGNEFVQSHFDPESLKSILEFLGNSGGDRSAWLITMICASRGRYHSFLLNFDFTWLVSDEEVLNGIEMIKNVIRPLIRIEDQILINPYKNENETLTMRTPQKQIKRSNSINNSSSSGLKKMATPLLNIYNRSPSSSVSSNTQNLNSPTFSPRHFPSKKPTTLLASTLRDRDVEDEVNKEEVEDDPFMEDLIRFGGAKRFRNNTDQIITDLSEADSTSISDLVILTKPSTTSTEFESFIKMNPKKRNKRF